MTESKKVVTLSFDDRGVARLTLVQPEKHNPMSGDLIPQMRDALAEIKANSACRVVVLAAEGKSFSAGGDFRWMKIMSEQSRAERVAGSAGLGTVLYDLNRLPQPLIGRIQGSAYGGGVGLVACCDIAIAVRTAKLSLTEVTLGLVPANIAPYVARKMGEANARRTFFTGKVMTADEAAAMGLINVVVEPDDLDQAIEQEIASILRCAPGAVAATKHLIEYVLSHDDADNRRFTAGCLADAWDTEEGKAGIASFLAKGTPPWRPKSS